MSLPGRVDSSSTNGCNDQPETEAAGQCTGGNLEFIDVQRPEVHQPKPIAVRHKPSSAVTRQEMQAAPATKIAPTGIMAVERAAAQGRCK